ncbi:MAG: Flavobacterium phage 11b [Bacteroidota bacterium]|jgi:hypothetical protein
MAINPELTTAVRVGELPTGAISETSKIAIENGTDLYKITGQDLIDYMNINVGTRQFQIIDLWVTPTYIDDNFDSTGLGIGICEGLAICNGQNGTPPMDGLVSVGYGTNYNSIGGFGGYKDGAVISHSHVYTDDITAEGEFPAIATGFPIKTSGAVTQNTSGDGSAGGTTYYTSTVGVSAIGRNMPPFIVLLKCMKL